LHIHRNCNDDNWNYFQHSAVRDRCSNKSRFQCKYLIGLKVIQDSISLIFLNSNFEIYRINTSDHPDLESYRSNFRNPVLSASRMRDNVERWLIHESLPFDQVKNEENTFQILVKHAGKYGIPADIFEPKAQLGILVIGAKIDMKNNQIIRYRGFNDEEKNKFANKVSDFCNSIEAISKIITEDGKQKVAVYVVLDDKENINQQVMFDAIDSVSEKHEKTSRFLLKTF